MGRFVNVMTTRTRLVPTKCENCGALFLSREMSAQTSGTYYQPVAGQKSTAAIREDALQRDEALPADKRTWAIPPQRCPFCRRFSREDRSVLLLCGVAAASFAISSVALIVFSHPVIGGILAAASLACSMVTRETWRSCGLTPEQALEWLERTRRTAAPPSD